VLPAGKICAVYDAPIKQHAVVMTTVEATVDQCFAVGVDIESYPQWVDSITSVEVEERDGEGRPLRVRFHATALGRSASYVLAYDYSHAPSKLSWTLVDGDVTSRLEGSYIFDEAPPQEGFEGPATDVTYDLIVDLKIPLPGYVKRRAEDKIVSAALERFKSRVLEVTSE